MTETRHARSRRASLAGLILQLVVFAGILALGFLTRSHAMHHLAWYLLGGVPIWFVALLVFRQRELAALEALDLEELRREKQATGGGEAIFGEEGGAGLAFRVAEARLRWMQRWLIPGFGLGTAVYLGVMGILGWRWLVVGKLTLGAETWPELARVPIAMVVLAIAMLGVFLFSRYASGMGRVAEWQLLRGCGSYMLGTSLASMALLVCLGIEQYADVATWEQALAYLIPVVMIVLAVETFVNFVLDIYRPRAPEVEPRAAFDSRLLGLIAEPGGIATSIAEAINYQFGFQVSQTWFYQLLQRTFVPLIGTAGVALWLLTCIVIVQPYEHVIVERFGRQFHPEDPLGPGLHWKLPWPIDVARVYNTGQLHQLSVGFRQFDAEPDYQAALKQVQLWTDTKHLGQDHFDFLICPTTFQPGEGEPLLEEPAAGDDEARQDKAYPVHLIRMAVVVQYRIRPDKLYLFSQAMRDPHRAMRDIAWEEVVRFNASSTADFLMGEELSQIGRKLRQRITARVAELGLDVVYVGVTNVHPEKTVAEAYRDVIGAEQEKVAAIREARVVESQKLAAVAGDAQRARRLATATVRVSDASERLNTALQTLRDVDPDVVAELSERLLEHRALFRARTETGARLEEARSAELRAKEDFALGLGQTLSMQARAEQEAAQAAAAKQAADAALEEALAPLRAEASRRLSPQQAEALVRSVEAQVAGAYWDQELNRGFTQSDLGGTAAGMLAAALADRWQIEMSAAANLARAEIEREAYRAAPQVYKIRRELEVLVEGMKDARKFFLAFDPGDRLVRVRFVAEDQPGTDIIQGVRPPERE